MRGVYVILLSAAGSAHPSGDSRADGGRRRGLFGAPSLSGFGSAGFFSWGLRSGCGFRSAFSSRTSFWPPSPNGFFPPLLLRRRGAPVFSAGARARGLGFAGRGRVDLVAVEDQLRQRLNLSSSVVLRRGRGFEEIGARSFGIDGSFFRALPLRMTLDIAVGIAANRLRMFLHAHLDALAQQIDLGDGTAPVRRVDNDSFFGAVFSRSSYASCSYFRQHISRPHVPEIFVGSG